jgi:hypothetical protein
MAFLGLVPGERSTGDTVRRSGQDFDRLGHMIAAPRLRALRIAAVNRFQLVDWVQITAPPSRPIHFFSHDKSI